MFVKVSGSDIVAFASTQMVLEFKELSRNPNHLRKQHQWWCPVYVHV